MFYRIKSKQNELLHLLFVSNTFGNTDYFVLVNIGLQQLRYKLNELRRIMKVSELNSLCLKLNSEVFKVNSCNEGSDDDECQSLCDLPPKLYGNK